MDEFRLSRHKQRSLLFIWYNELHWNECSWLWLTRYKLLNYYIDQNIFTTDTIIDRAPQKSYQLQLSMSDAQLPNLLTLICIYSSLFVIAVKNLIILVFNGIIRSFCRYVYTFLSGIIYDSCSCSKLWRFMQVQIKTNTWNFILHLICCNKN